MIILQLERFYFKN